MKIISQVPMGNGKLKIQFEGNSKETKPTGSFLAKSSSWIEEDSGSVYTYNGTAWSLAKNGQMKDLPVVTPTDNGKILKVEGGVWSLGEDGGLPVMTGKNGKVLGVTLDAQDHEQAEWVTPSGGGGAEKFIVTLTEDDSGAETVWTSDKTIAEIVAADAANQVVVCKVVYAEIALPPFEIPFSAALTNVALFGGVISEGEPKVLVALGMLDGGVTQWTVESVELGSSNAPLIVTLTADQSTGNLVGNKTYKEVYDAVDGGQTVTFKSAFSGFTVATNALSVGLANSGYAVALVFGGSIIEAEGEENDYVSIHVH